MPDETTQPDLDAPAIFAILASHEVDYVLVGGYAAQLHGARRPTTDVDLTPERSTGNLGRLAAALVELGARIRVEGTPQGLPFDTSAEALAALQTLNLRTAYGDLDLTFEPEGTQGYVDLVRAAEDRSIGAVLIRVATLLDVIRSKVLAVTLFGDGGVSSGGDGWGVRTPRRSVLAGRWWSW